MILDWCELCAAMRWHDENGDCVGCAEWAEDQRDAIAAFLDADDEVCPGCGHDFEDFPCAGCGCCDRCCRCHPAREES